MSSLREAQRERDRLEQRRAVRALLARPLLTSDDDELALVRRHHAALQRFFAESAGWTLHVEREMARLRKVPAVLGDAGRPARGREKDAPFSRRRYVLLCLALAALERSDRQTTLRYLAKQVAQMAAGDPALAAQGIEFELAGRDQRRDLVAVIRWLIGHGVMRRISGDEVAFVQERGDALYQVDRKVLAWILASAQPPSFLADTATADRVEVLVEEVRLDSDEARVRELRHAMVRRLLDDPVLYYDELTEEELDYITRSRARLLDTLGDMTGLVPEVRREGIALVDPRGDASDVALPEEGTDGHVTLLLAEHLADVAREGATASVDELRAHILRLASTYRKHWRKAATEPGAEVELVERALTHLKGLGLIRREGDRVTPRPAIGRFALVPVTEEEE